MNREQLIAPEQYNLVSEFEKYATGTGKKALIYVNAEGNKKEITYDELITSANKAANVFKANGLEKGDVVLVMVPRLIEAYVTYIGALKAGLVVIPSSEMLRSSDIEYRLAHSDAKAIVAFDAFTDQFNEVKNMKDVQLIRCWKSEEGSTFINRTNGNCINGIHSTTNEKFGHGISILHIRNDGETKRCCSYTWLGVCAFTDDRSELVGY